MAFVLNGDKPLAWPLGDVLIASQYTSLAPTRPSKPKIDSRQGDLSGRHDHSQSSAFVMETCCVTFNWRDAGTTPGYDPFIGTIWTGLSFFLFLCLDADVYREWIGSISTRESDNEKS